MPIQHVRLTPLAVAQQAYIHICIYMYIWGGGLAERLRNDGAGAEGIVETI